MKKIYKLFLLFGILFCLTACSESFLDKEKDDKKSEEEVYSRYEEVNKNVATAYWNARYAMRPLVWLEHFSSSVITDECESSNVEGNIGNRYNQGDWSPNSDFPGNNRQFWNSMYTAIRHINLTLEGIEKYKTPDNPLSPGDLEKRIGELYFLRGYMHYRLMMLYGEIPYIDHSIATNDAMKFERESIHAVVDKIVADAETAYKKVAEMYNRSDEHFGRVDKGACLGLIAKVRWVAATPLYNGATQFGYQGERIFEKEYGYKAERWIAARDAAKRVLDMTVNGAPRYKLFDKYDNHNFQDDGNRNLNGSLLYRRLWDMFYDFESIQDESVFFVTLDKDNWWQGDQYAPSRGGGSRQQPVQEQVDEYEYMAPDGYGYPVYSKEARDAGYDDSNPYVNRDPRFYRDIIYHGAPYRDNNNNPRQMNTAEGPDKINANNATTTGYYLRKFMKDGYNKSGGFDIHSPAIWRLPEFIYIYAEAVNETAGPNQEIYDMINKVRARSFMNPMPPSTLTNKQLMREYIRRERRVELFYENKRPWDCRLYLEPSSKAELDKEKIFKASGHDNTERSVNYWKQHHGAYPKCQRMINGMHPVEDSNGKIEIDGKKYRMERFCKEERVFEAPKHYYFPIQNTELNVCPSLKQNPGW